MSGQIYKVTETNPRFEMELAILLKDTGLDSRESGGGVVYAAFDSGGSLTGAAAVRQMGADCLLKYVVVIEARRGKGLGSRLVGKALTFCSGECERAWVISGEDSMPFFERFGFEGATTDMIPDLIRRSRDLKEIEIASFRVLLLEFPTKWPKV
ncbi:MAG: GNAT family N-acetyltransferase [Bacteroidales bacterium]|nr:GNAT family N-acetyltransferase [Candidatus Latescibacterota bacterium]